MPPELARQESKLDVYPTNAVRNSSLIHHVRGKVGSRPASNLDRVLIALSLIVWLAVVLVVTAVCRTAARGDGRQAASLERGRAAPAERDRAARPERDQAAPPERDRDIAIGGVAIWDGALPAIASGVRHRPAPTDPQRITAPGAR